MPPPINRIDQDWVEPQIPECSGNIAYVHVNKAFDDLSDREPLPEEESRVDNLDPRGGGSNPAPACQGTVVSQPNYHVTGNVGEEVTEERDTPGGYPTAFVSGNVTETGCGDESWSMP